MTSYSKRESIFERSPRVWRIEPDALIGNLPAGEVRLPWSQVRQVRLCYAPTELKAWRHVFTVDGSGGVSISFDNGHYVSVGEFEDRSAAFSAFIVAVLQKVSEHAPAARLYLGSPPLSYAALLAAAAIPMAMLCWMILPVPSTILGVELNIVGRLLIIAAMLPLVGMWMVRARPRTATMKSLRESLP